MQRPSRLRSVPVNCTAGRQSYRPWPAAATASPTAGTWSVDYSQQASAQISFTDLVIDGTTNTKFTSSAHPIGKNMVGNLINVASGTGFTVQTIEVASVAGTADKSLGTLSSTGGTGKPGRLSQQTGTLSGVIVGSNKAFVASGAYTRTATCTFSASVNPSISVPPSRIIGYYQTRGDIVGAVNAANRPTVTLSTNTGLTAINFSNPGWWLENVIINCSSSERLLV